MYIYSKSLMLMMANCCYTICNIEKGGPCFLENVSNLNI